MKPGFLKISHAAAAVFGLLVSFALLQRQQTLSGDYASTEKGESSRIPERRQTTDSGETTGDVKLDANGKRIVPQFRSSEYQKAWDAIADQSLPAQQRYIAQMEILRQWAEVDLEGALIAAFDTSWDGTNGMGIQGLLQAFDKAFAKRPTESWDIITSGRFGLGAALAKARWARTVVKENPLLVANHLKQIPYQTRVSIFPQVLSAIKEDPSKIGAFYDKLTELPQDRAYRDMILQTVKELGARGSLDEIRGKFLESTSDAQRTILVHEYGKSLADSPLPAIQGELSKLPEADRGRMLRSVIMHAETGGEQTPQLLGMILEAGEYKEVLYRVHDHIRAYASTPEKQASLAAWAVTLPQSADAPAVINRSVSAYINSDPQAARSWLESVPSSQWGRNTALAEYSQQMLMNHNNPEDSAWALSQITDPKIQQEATNWRAGWEKRNNKN